MKPRYLFLCLLPLFYQLTVTAQSLAINTDGSTANASALLDIKSTTKGLLIPRMSKTERNSIASPATGLMVFQASPDSIGFYYYNGSSWSWVTSNSNGSDWKLTGNSGTDTATNFIGTTDDMAIRFKINNQQAGLISSNNNLLGLGAGKSLGTSTGITAIGVAALGLNRNKNDLVAIGDSALYFNSTGAILAGHGSKNSAFGSKVLLNNTIGSDNTGIGYHALYSNTTGMENIANGEGALENNTIGIGNTADGYFALHSNTTGYANTANGFVALEKNTTGQLNIASGYQALVNNTTGSYNIAIGDGTLLGNLTNSYNVAIGRFASYYNVSDNNTSVGDNSSFTHFFGDNNTSVGSYSLYNNGYGTFVTAIGDSADVLYNSLTNATAIGAKAAVNCDNCLVLGSVKGQNYATSNVNVGIGTVDPDALLEVKSGAVLFDSTVGSTPASGTGTRMMWIPAKAAFRAGSVFGTYWDNANIGQNSVAFGENTSASGGWATAMGFGTAANGFYSTAMGYMSGAWGTRSTAMGFSTFAFGDNATSTGEQTEARSNSSLAAGAFVKSKSYAGFAVGIYNDSTNAASATAINNLNRIFQVGNGTADNARSNAMTILQNGNVGIGTVTPSSALDVIGSAEISSNLTVQSGMGIIRNISGTQLKKLSLGVTVNATFTAGQSQAFTVTWPQSFSGASIEAYVGNITSGAGGWAEVIMSVSNVTTTGAILYVNNPRSSSWSPNYTVNIIAIGPQ